MSELTVDGLLHAASEQGASDLHLQCKLPPQIRVDGEITSLPNHPVLELEDIQNLLGSMLTKDMRQDYEERRSVDFSRAVPGLARFRVNCFLERGRPAAVFRRIPEDIPTLAQLKAPAVLMDFARAPRGLVLVTGPTGSGKSTTLAAMLDLINNERHDHILTIEDPIEFVHQPKKCLVRQREVGGDTPNFNQALIDSLREDPDVILVGEMRDLETISTALTAAETGHLVFGTLHTSSAPGTIDRIIDVFPPSQQHQVRVMLASSLVGIVTQTLMPKIGGGRAAAFEIMAADNAVRALIRHQGGEQLRSVMQTQAQKGMQTIDRHLAHMVFEEIVSADDARDKSQNIDEFEQLLASMRKGGEVASMPIVQEDDLIQMAPEPVAAPPSASMPPPPDYGTSMPPPPDAGTPMPPPPDAGTPMPPPPDTGTPMPPPPSTGTPMPPPPQGDISAAPSADSLSNENGVQPPEAPRFN